MEEEEHSVTFIKEEFLCADGDVKMEVNHEEADLFNDPLNSNLSDEQRENLELSSEDSLKKDETLIQSGSISRLAPKTYANRRKNLPQETSTSGKNKDSLTRGAESKLNINPVIKSETFQEVSECFASAVIKSEIFEEPNISTEPGSPDAEPDIRYMDSGDIVNDDIVYCLECLGAFSGDCPKHGALVPISDTLILNRGVDEFRALKTAPLQLTITDSKIANAGRGVIARLHIPDRSKFGPYEGKKVPQTEGTEYAWLIREDGYSAYCIDASDPSSSNWMRFVNCARNERERNLLAFQYQGCIYFRTIRVIRPGEELLVWCGRNYAQRLGIDPTAMDENRFRNLSQVTSLETSSLSYKERRRQRLEKKKATLTRKFFNPSFKGTHVRYPSAVCTRQFASRDLMEEHHQAHKEGLLFLCGECFKCFRKKGSYENHMLSHSNEYSFGCPLCDKSFCSDREVRIHVFSHCQRNPPVCALCQKQMMQRSDLKYHLKEHFGEVYKTHRCTKCNEGFPGQIELRRHLGLCKNGGLHICSDCYCFFLAGKDLRRHVRTHKRVKSEGFRCRKCGQVFALFIKLEEHLKKHYSEVRSYQCGKCEERMLWKEVKAHVPRCILEGKT